MTACTDCGRKRDAFRPAARLANKTVLFVCRQCWRDLDYADYMSLRMSVEDLAALTKERRR